LMLGSCTALCCRASAMFIPCRLTSCYRLTDMSLLHQQRAEACNCNLDTLSTAYIIYQLLGYFINCLDTFINCLDTLAGQLVTSERGVCGDSWHSIITTLCHILHSVSHWPIVVYFVNCNYSARSPCQLQRHSARVTQVCQGSIHVSHWLVLDLPINGLADRHTSLAFTYASGLRIGVDIHSFIPHQGSKLLNCLSDSGN
jgi:hypothetical protein